MTVTPRIVSLAALPALAVGMFIALAPQASAAERRVVHPGLAMTATHVRPQPRIAGTDAPVSPVGGLLPTFHSCQGQVGGGLLGDLCIL